MSDPPEVPKWMADTQVSTEAKDVDAATLKRLGAEPGPERPPESIPAKPEGPYDYEKKGREDFAAGRRDDRLYELPEAHGTLYRRGWQGARRDAETPPRPPEPEPTAPKASEPPPKVDPAPTAEEPPKPKKKPHAPKPAQLGLFE